MKRREFLRNVMFTASGLAIPAYAGIVTQSGSRYFGAVPGGGGGGSSGLAYETTADKYVSSTGNNANAGTSGAPYATIAYALTQISDGQRVGVLSDLTENVNWATISSGSSVGGWRSVCAINAVRTVTGTMKGTGTNKYLRFKGLYFVNNGSTNDDKQFQNGDATYLKFITCGFEGGPAAAGNYVTVDCGSYQLYENCYALTVGGRYAFLVFQKTNTLFRRCVVRTDNWGSPADDGNPNGGIQLYSTTNASRINCIAVDGQAQRTLNEWLGMFVNTNNVGSSTAISDYGCIVSDCPTSGITVEGKAGNCDYVGINNISVRNESGFTEQMQTGNTGGSITLLGGEYSGNSSYGLVSWGAETVTNTNLNTSGNTSGNFHNITAGSGNTTNALNMNTLLSAMKKIGVDETMWGETGWNVTQAEDLFPFQCEDVIRAAYAAKSTRGFCGGSYTLTSYLKR